MAMAPARRTCSKCSHSSPKVWRTAVSTSRPFRNHNVVGIGAFFDGPLQSGGLRIAEGAAKRGSREFARYVDISLGSLAEVAYLLLLARDLGILQLKDYEMLEDLRSRAGGLTWRLVRGLRGRLG